MDSFLELLAPAKNREQGMAAIDHGADALYIGAPAFGARVAAGNSIDDIEALVRYAHLFHSKVFVTVNTLLFDDELEAAERLIWQLYNVGVDALIVQDLGLLELNLPPIALHASTQTHNIDPRRVKFLEQVGFRRVILARETSLDQMAALRRNVSIELEAFVQGALCVCYSGQCYMSQYLNGRSGNRGCCAQPCRSSYDLYNADGKLLRKEQHLLSLKDFSAAQHVESMVAAGITSFKIEGRLKDMAYVKNVTAYYRQLLDAVMERKAGFYPASQGKTTFHFMPDLERTFNRDFTDYFLVGRQPMASAATQKSLGKRMGTMMSGKGEWLELKCALPLVPGDGLCFFSNEERSKLEGFLVNRVEGNRIWPNKPLRINKPTAFWRNNDFAFEKQLQGNSAERKIAVAMTLDEVSTGVSLTLCDEGGTTAVAVLDCDKQPARDTARATDTIVRQLSKMGGTPFVAGKIDVRLSEPLFLPASQLNELRRQAVEQLVERRIAAAKPMDCPLEKNEVPYYVPVVDYRANVVNRVAEAFYNRHQCAVAEHGLEQTHDYEEKALMTTKYCLRYELGQCLMHKCNSQVAPDYKGDLFLRNNDRLFRLHFDCARCEMQLFSAKNELLQSFAKK